MLWGIHINTCIGAASQDVATPHLKKLLAYALAYDPDLRTFGVRANMAQTMIDGLQTQLTSIIAERWDIILKNRWFPVFSVKGNAFAEYKYSDFPKKIGSTCVVNKLTLNEENFFDFRFHYTLELKVKNEVKIFHVTLNESNVADTFFDHKIPEDVFGNKFFSPVYRFAESHFQDNEAPVESVISSFDNQCFPNQGEATGEARSFIKINGDPSGAGSMEISINLANMSVDGAPEWDIQPVSLPVSFGRYSRTIAKSFDRIDQTKGKKHDFYVWLLFGNIPRASKCYC